MKAKKLWILLTLLSLICGICAIQFGTNLVADDKVAIELDTKAEVADKGVNPTDGESDRLRKKIENLEATIAKLEDKIAIGKIRTGSFTMPGLKGSLVGLPCIWIKIEDLPLEAIRYGLTKKNIIEAVESQFRRHNIKTLNVDMSASDFSHEERILYGRTSEKPKLHVEVICSALKDGLYMGYVKVSMKQDWSIDYPPDVPEGFEEKGASALQKSAIYHSYTTEWARNCVVYPGKLGNFAEDEKNSLEELVCDFINDYLAANPKGFVSLIHSYVGTKDNPAIPWAVIRGQVFHEDDTVDGVKIVKIHKDKVEFEKDGKRWTQEEDETPGPGWK